VKQPEFARLAAGDDPRPRWSARQQIARIRANDLAKLASLYKDEREAKKAAGAFEQSLNELDQSAASYGAILAAAQQNPGTTVSTAAVPGPENNGAGTYGT